MRRYLVLIIGFGAAVVFVRLGIWQSHRLADRRARNATIASRLAQPPVDLLTARALREDSLGFRRAVGHGAFDFARELVVVAQSQRSVPGVHLVTPLLLDDGVAVLVERGWIASPHGRTVDLTTLYEPDSAQIEGVLLEAPTSREVGRENGSWPRQVRVASPRYLQASYPYPLMGLVLRRTVLPEGVHAALRPVALPELTDGPHLSYAIEWFAFAVIAAVGSIALYRRSRAESTTRRRSV